MPVAADLWLVTAAVWLFALGMIILLWKGPRK